MFVAIVVVIVLVAALLLGGNTWLWLQDRYYNECGIKLTDEQMKALERRQWREIFDAEERHVHDFLAA